MDLEAAAKLLSAIRPLERVFFVWSSAAILLVRFVTEGERKGGLCAERLGDAYWPVKLVLWGWILVAVLVVFERLVEAGVTYAEKTRADEPKLAESTGDESAPAPSLLP